MGPNPSATYLGNDAGLATGVTGTPKELKALVAPQLSPAPHEHADRLDRSKPFGLTVIVGGTNVRFCLSTANNPEPLKRGVKWQEMKADLSADLKRAGKNFTESHEISYPYMAKMCLDFIKSAFEPSDIPPPLENLCAITFSVAGQVTESGRSARITTTNTGLTFRNQPIAADLLAAMEKEIAVRNEAITKQGCPELAWPSLPDVQVDVMNDAQAALLGEVFYGDLRDKNVLKVIVGTGAGSEAQLINYNGAMNARPQHASDAAELSTTPPKAPNMNEAGHRIVYDCIQRGYICHPNGELAQFIEPDGSFKKLPDHLIYAENVIAGPWNAIRFIRSILEDDNAKIAVAKRIVADPQDSSQIMVALKALHKLGALNVRDRTEWAINSDAGLVRAVNNIILNPRLVVEKCDLDARRTSGHTTEEDTLIEKAYEHFWKYFTEVGRVIGAAYHTTKQYGFPLDVVIVGGGIGEHCNTFAKELRRMVLKHMHRAGNIPEGVIDFSVLTPEARECAANRANVIAKEEANAAVMH